MSGEIYTYERLRMEKRQQFEVRWWEREARSIERHIRDIPWWAFKRRGRCRNHVAAFRQKALDA